ncbi:hypothetical protein Cgig2_012448 [Carnegiea gigantea]|uniref:Glyoxalase/fosfomycin resistance/dioxygenase domain-containing protein n=1 Tax=Carnegiea gigantea TaxID=171969 RepID=A0A9Q1QMI7_9CARY|nr:hypothetical protein Cgig2_012448 [Carnegiea gigantea]
MTPHQRGGSVVLMDDGRTKGWLVWIMPSLKPISIVCVLRLFGYGIGIHLLQAPDPEKLPKKTEINPKDNHISFQCESMGAVEKKLKEMGIRSVRARVEEGGIYVDQLFFHDPDGFMIEICNCDNLPVIPLTGEMGRSCSRINLLQQQQTAPVVQQ